ncbi:hypothetical protein J416_13539 [Gracilibacillus halophilus YIM-C55.5]|uniref:DUF3298 domain-containing protein n=1 Tax=Gracilibacillus halophilus YIM-C55.5 TaxID=1308866 RepID=N4WN21_9BACI|nr:DUF3298 and DUF4163 domain-containing protein [Gracilibacillus halophilus]ENH95910.1 hypothetical protein J416_13539 [Gracilibacillus halophilus YIM-C55.5]
MKRNQMKSGVIIFITVMIASLFSSMVLASEKSQKTATVEPHDFKDIEELKYPQVSDMEENIMEEKINQAFDKYIRDSYKEYKDNIKMADEYDFVPDYQTDYEVKYNQFPYLSILTSNYIFSGGAHGNTTVRSFNFDASNGTWLSLTDILQDEEQLKAVRDYVWEYAIERPDIFYPDLKKEDVKLNANTAFYFTGEGITLVFQRYEIAPYVSGNQEIPIPEDIYEEA